MIQKSERLSSVNRLLPITAVLGLALLLFFPSCGRKEEKEVKPEVIRPVKLITVTSSTDALQLKFPGMVRAAKRADLAFQVEGTLKQLPVDEGQEVKV